ncbi:MAG: MBOAT family protein [Mangrovibacterium sp.]
MEQQVKNILESLLYYQPDKPLFYTGLAFWLAFTAFVGLYAFIYRKNRLRNSYLLAISWFIYYRMNGAFLVLLLFSCLANYGFARLVGQGRRTKLWLTLSASFNLLLLGYFKYAYFFTETANQLFNTEWQVFNWLGWCLNQVVAGFADTHTILLPIGISFYTFQAISYLVDVFSKKVEAVRNPLDFSFYLSFFPQLVAGPIVRAASFIPQLYQQYRLTKAEFGHAVYLITKGMFKKLVIADFLALNYIDRVFDAPLSFSGLENLLAVYAYSIQIYCDFSGYTDIAIGLALMLGFKIPVNFNAPYQATSLTDFWRRWHISLSLWLKDYLYIPLGGNRNGIAKTYLNLMVTMILGGLWHGANLRFLIWGAIHGAGLVIEKIIRKLYPAGNKNGRWRKAVTIFLTFQLVSFAWIFFRANNQMGIAQFFYQLSHHFTPQVSTAGLQAYAPTIGIFLLGLILIWFPWQWKEQIRGRFIRLALAWQIIAVVIILLIISQAAQSALQPFIYFRF